MLHSRGCGGNTLQTSSDFGHLALTRAARIAAYCKQRCDLPVRVNQNGKLGNSTALICARSGGTGNCMPRHAKSQKKRWRSFDFDSGRRGSSAFSCFQVPSLNSTMFLHFCCVGVCLVFVKPACVCGDSHFGRQPCFCGAISACPQFLFTNTK